MHFLKLRSEFSIHIDTDGRYGLINTDGNFFHLSKIEAVVIYLAVNGMPMEEIDQCLMSAFGREKCLKQVLQKMGFFQVVDNKVWIPAITAEIPSPFDKTQVIHFRSHRSNYPLVVLWRITTVCNSKCRYCYAHNTGIATEMETGMEIIRQATLCGVKGISLTGGDPLCNPFFYEFTNKALEAGIEIAFLTKNRIDINKLSVMDSRLFFPGFSVDSVDPLVADGMVGRKGYHAEIMKSIEELRDKQYSFSIQMTVTKETVDSVVENVQGLLKLGPRILKVCRYELTGEPEKDQKCQIETDMWETVKQLIRRKTGEDKRICFIDGEISHECISGKTRMAIDEMGHYMVCDRVDANPDMPSIWDVGFYDYWNSEEYKNLCAETGRRCMKNV